VLFFSALQCNWLGLLPLLFMSWFLTFTKSSNFWIVFLFLDTGSIVALNIIYINIPATILFQIVGESANNDAVFKNKWWFLCWFPSWVLLWTYKTELQNLKITFLHHVSAWFLQIVLEYSDLSPIYFLIMSSSRSLLHLI